MMFVFLSLLIFSAVFASVGTESNVGRGDRKQIEEESSVGWTNYDYYMHERECPTGFTQTELRGMPGSSYGWMEWQATQACGGKKAKGYRRYDQGKIKLCCTETYETESTNVICSDADWLTGKATSTKGGCENECSRKSSCDTYCWSNKSPGAHWDCLMYKNCATKVSKFSDGKATSGYTCYKKQSQETEVADPWDVYYPPTRDCSSFNKKCNGCRGYLASCCSDSNCGKHPNGPSMFCKEGLWEYSCDTRSVGEAMQALEAESIFAVHQEPSHSVRNAFVYALAALGLGIVAYGAGCHYCGKGDHM